MVMFCENSQLNSCALAFYIVAHFEAPVAPWCDNVGHACIHHSSATVLDWLLGVTVFYFIIYIKSMPPPTLHKGL